MPLHAGTAQRQQQHTGMIPEHFLGKAVLKMSLQELQQFVQEQLAENPALTMEESSQCPACGCALIGDFCPACGSESVDVEDSAGDGDDWEDGLWASPGRTDDEACEALSFVATPSSLTDHLKEQLRVSATGDDLRIAEFLVDCLDEDGYLREPLIEIASRFGVSVPQLEQVLSIVQSLDPAGVGARDLRECLLLQITQIEDDSPARALAEVIIREHWEAVSRMRLNRLAEQLGVSPAGVTDALDYIREALSPCPAAGFRDPWEKLAPRKESRQVPDVLIRREGDEVFGEVTDPVSGRPALDEAYSSLYAEMSQKRGAFRDSEREHIREYVQSARTLIESLEFRRSALGRIVDELIRSQSDYVKYGPSHLKPLTRKELAKRLGVHESTVCRATANKTAMLPSGEVVSLDTFFDSALPVKELVRSLAVERREGRPMSDGEIAERLTAMGIRIARRTVAKYRGQLRVLPLEYRLAA